jgi:hypothetical protein
MQFLSNILKKKYIYLLTFLQDYSSVVEYYLALRKAFSRSSYEIQYKIAKRHEGEIALWRAR